MSIIKNFKSKVLLKNNAKKFFAVSFFAAFLIFTIFSLSSSLEPKAQALGSDNISGYAWSQGIGWLSLNCSNSNCLNSNYGVNLDPTTKLLTGYAWSSNLGWVKFGGLSGWPTGAGTSGMNAHLDTSNNIEGWIRVCAGMNDAGTPPPNQTTSNNSCTGPSRDDGWDGWISLKGTGYGVTINQTTGTASMTGYAWGSDVVGWVQFTASVAFGSNPSLALSANSQIGSINITSGDTVTLSSTGYLLDTSTVNGVATYTVDPNGAANWSGAKSCPTSLTTPLSYAPFTLNNFTGATVSYTYTLTCKKSSDGTNIPSTITVNVQPSATTGTLSLKASAPFTSGTTITMNSGETVTLSSTGSSLGTPGTTSYTTDPNGATNWSGNKTCPVSLTTPVTNASFVLNNYSASQVSYTYTLSCPNAAPSTVTVNVRPALPSLTLKANASVGPITVNSGDTVTLSSIGYSLNTGVNGTASLNWSGSKTCPSSLTTPTSYPSFSVTNPSTTNPAVYSYALTCTKSSGGTILSNTVTVNVRPALAPSVTLKAYSDPGFTNQITSPLPVSGGNVYLKWSLLNVTSCDEVSVLPNDTDYYPDWYMYTDLFSQTTTFDPLYVTSSHTFGITCHNSSTTVTASAPVQVGIVTPPGCPALGIPPCPKKQPHFIEN